MATDNQDTQFRDWDWEQDGALDGMYVETRLVHVKNGPSAGQVKPVVDFHVGVDDELVTVWLPTVLRRMFREELQLRRKSDFEAGERIKVTPRGKRRGPNGSYWDFEDPIFEFPAPRPTAATMLAPAYDEGIDALPVEPDVATTVGGPPPAELLEREDDGDAIPY
jgi:hypothetical protein